MSLASWMAATCWVASQTGVSSYGKPTYGTRRALRCRVEARRQLVRGTQGEDAVSSHVVYCLEEVLLTDRLWLPGVALTDDAARKPLAVQATSDKAGARTLYKVEL